jgi:hypothetical protein
MSYFNHAYVKAAVISSLEEVKDVATIDLEAGELGVVDATTYVTVDWPAAAAGVPAETLLVFGNYNQVDTLDGKATKSSHGGYSESIKTKMIKPHYVNKLWKSECVAVEAQYIEITIPDGCFLCDGSTAASNQLRIDIKGDEALRYLNRFSYVTLDYRECCAQGTEVTGATVVSAWVDRINEDPLLNPFITASAVSGGSTNNRLKLVIDYTATFFDNCSFDTRDWHATAPLSAIVSPVDDDGDACNDTCMTAAVSGVAVAEFGKYSAYAVSTKAETTGETVIDEIILEGRYRQDGGWNQGNKDSARFREIQHGDALLGCGTGAVDRTAFYACYYLQHSVPRFNNPTGVFDNDQYLYKFYLPCTAKNEKGETVTNPDLAKMDAMMGYFATAAGITFTTGY